MMKIRSLIIIISLTLPGLVREATQLDAAEPTFSSRIVARFEFAPVYGIPAMLDEDTLMDLIVVSSDGDVYSLHNDGSFGFSIEWGDYAGRGVCSLLIEDMDGDNVEDLVSVNSADDNISIFLREPGGAFHVVNRIDVGDDPVDAASGDFNHDQYSDLAVVNNRDYTITILAGDGSGGFVPIDTLATGFEPTGIVSGDFNQDGDVDLATAHFATDNVYSFLGDGTGQFSHFGTYPASNGPNGIAIGDFNEDEIPDLVVSNAYSNGIAILIGEGDGSFRREEVLSLGASITWIRIGDVDLDGHLDLLSDHGGMFSVFWGEGEGTFSGETIMSMPYSYGSHLEAGTIIDSDADGRNDVIAFQSGTNDLSIIKQSDDRVFFSSTRFPVSADANEFLLRDFDNDNHLDAVLIDRYGQDLFFLPGDGDGGFGPSIITSGIGKPSLAVSGHFDNDEYLDLAAQRDFWPYDSLWIVHGEGDGTFSSPSLFYGGDNLSQLIAGDFNEDGITDLALGDDLNSDRLRILLVDSTGTPTERYQSISLPADPIIIHTEDFDQDGHLDLAIVVEGVSDTDIFFYRGNGAGNFSGAGRRSFGGHITHLTTGEFRDVGATSYPDLVVKTRIGSGSHNTYSGVLWANSGGFSFFESGMFFQDETDWEMVSGNYNGDEYLDLIIAQGLSFAMFTGNGMETLTEEGFMYGLSADATDFGVGDLDENGLDDIAIISWNESIIEVVENIGRPLGIQGRQPEQPGSRYPLAYSLSQNYPNPFNPSTTFELTIPVDASGEVDVSVKIYDLRGRCIRSMIDTPLEPGKHLIHWDGRDEHGRQVASGVYLCRMKAGEFVSTRKLILAK